MPGSPPRDRLIDTATRLFYRRGITASGVDTIAAQAGVSKPTLYACFRTKHGLVAAVLERQHRQRRESLERFLRLRHKLPAEKRLPAIFDWIASYQRADWARGCPFVNASVELSERADAAAREVVRRHKQWFRGVLAELATEAGAARPAAIASQLHLLIEGANARMLAESDLSAIDDAKRAAEVILADACKGRMRSRPAPIKRR